MRKPAKSAFRCFHSSTSLLLAKQMGVAISGHDQWYPVAFFVKTDEGEILGGLLGMIWAKRLYVSILAVQEPFRGKGYGTELMRRAEQYAIERGGRAQTRTGRCTAPRRQLQVPDGRSCGRILIRQSAARRMVRAAGVHE